MIIDIKHKHVSILLPYYCYFINYKYNRYALFDISLPAH